MTRERLGEEEWRDIEALLLADDTSPHTMAHVIEDILTARVTAARLAEAEWWHYQVHDDELCPTKTCVQCQRVAALSAPAVPDGSAKGDGDGT